MYRLLDPLKAVELENDWLPVAFDFSVLNVFFSELPWVIRRLITVSLKPLIKWKAGILSWPSGASRYELTTETGL